MSWTWNWPKSGLNLPRKHVVKVLLSKEQREILKLIADRLGISESEAVRMAIMDYAKSISLIKEKICGKIE